MSERTLQERITALEHEVAELRVALANLTPEKDWRRTIGMFTGDEVMKRIDVAALRYREKDRERARRRFEKEDRRKQEG